MSGKQDLAHVDQENYTNLSGPCRRLARVVLPCRRSRGHTHTRPTRANYHGTPLVCFESDDREKMELPELEAAESSLLIIWLRDDRASCSRYPPAELEKGEMEPPRACQSSQAIWRWYDVKQFRQYFMSNHWKSDIEVTYWKFQTKYVALNRKSHR